MEVQSPRNCYYYFVCYFSSNSMMKLEKDLTVTPTKFEKWHELHLFGCLVGLSKLLNAKFLPFYFVFYFLYYIVFLNCF